MVLQRGDQHFARQREKTLFKACRKGDGPLHKCRHFIQQFLAQQRTSPELSRQQAYALPDVFAPFREVRDHVTASAAAPGRNCRARSP